MYKIRKTFKVEMAHRLISSYSEECQNLHGHSYVIEVVLKSRALNPDDMVIDFKELKHLIKGYINEYDHAVMLSADDDQEFVNIVRAHNSNTQVVPFNPTAENMARYFFENLRYCICEYQDFVEDPSLVLEAVRIHETTTGWAEYSDDKKGAL